MHFNIQLSNVNSGSIFSPPNSGYVVANGENVTVTREMWFNQDDTFIVEELTLTNTGAFTIYNVSALWHMQSAPEASPNNPNYMGNETDFASFMSVPFQGKSNTITAYSTIHRCHWTKQSTHSISFSMEQHDCFYWYFG